jgi:hypothetical protein
MENTEADATRVLPVVRRRRLAPIRYAHSGVGPAVGPAGGPAGGPAVGPAGARWSPTGDAGKTSAGRASTVDVVDEAAAERTAAFPVVGAARVQPTERVRLADRVRRAGGARLTERIRLAGRGRPPEVAHE